MIFKWFVQRSMIYTNLNDLRYVGSWHCDDNALHYRIIFSWSDDVYYFELILILWITVAHNCHGNNKKKHC